MNTRLTIYIPLVVGFLSSLFLIVGCSKPVIEGKVVDYYNHPISDVNVSVEGTQFNSVTNSNGEYSIGYVPGNVKIKFVKAGYTENYMVFDILTETTFPAEQTQLLKIPSSKGVWVLGDNDYNDISQGKLIENGFRFYNQYIFSYKVSANFTELPYRENYKFLISSPDKVLLVKLRNQNYLIEEAADFSNSMSGYILKENSNVAISPNVSLRTVTLGRGYYSYISFLDTPEKPFNSYEPFRGAFYLSAYFFEIK